MFQYNIIYPGIISALAEEYKASWVRVREQINMKSTNIVCRGIVSCHPGEELEEDAPADKKPKVQDQPRKGIKWGRH